MDRVLILDDDTDLTVLMVELFRQVGVHGVVAHSLRDLQCRKTEALLCPLAILDINLGSDEPNGLDVYHWLEDNHFSGKIIFFTGHARFHPLVQEVARLPDVQVVDKPTDIDELLSLVGSVA